MSKKPAPVQVSSWQSTMSVRELSTTPFEDLGESPEDVLARHFSEEVDITPLDGAGRSSVSGVVATVFGSTGFVGRYVVNRLGRIGSQVMLPFRGEENSWRHLKVMGDLGQISARRFDIRNEDSIARAVEHSNVVINLLGRDWTTRNFTMDQVHHRAAELIARKSHEAGVIRLIHVGALGSDDCSPSDYMRTKALGEQAVLNAFPNATVLRPAPIFGAEDRLVIARAYMCRNMYMVPVLNPEARLQPLFVSDFATALMRCIEDSTTIGKSLDLAGPRAYTNAELTDAVAKLLNIEITKLPLTGMAAQIAAKIANLQINPFFTPDHVLSTAVDLTITDRQNNAIYDLGVEKPSTVEEEAYRFIAQFQMPKHRLLI
eukprot:CAMPEP_0177651516 /NCGR_PEP_ID=MMETSP0447-20121125/12601_1 /TAXON_ID=0 /ORGANISM="Stygamoeba regulata, Strain BSH-02190019" /LENGTH=373 /DNA_ID=CAMNT_0019154625 /DNA_START=137 /DNA_END=1258 /DNA_ORIENTATION=+